MNRETVKMNLELQKVSAPAPVGKSKEKSDISWLHRFASLVAILSFLSIVLGSHELGSPALRDLASLARMAAALAAILLAFWLWLGGAARYIKILGILEAALGTAAAFGVSGFGPASSPYGATVRAVFASAFFGLTVSCALFTRTDWRWDGTKTADLAAPSLRQLSVVTTAMIYAEFVLGTAYRAGAARLAPHLILGVASSIGALWMVDLALNKFPSLRELKIATVLTAELVVLQIFLGLVAYSMELNARALGRSLPGQAVIGPTHAAAAVLTFGAALFATLESFKYLSTASSGTAASKK